MPTSTMIEGWVEAEDRLRSALYESMRTEPSLVSVEAVLLGQLDPGAANMFRRSFTSAMAAEPTLAEAERSALQALGLDQLAEARSRVQSHLGGPTAIPADDLAIYAPADEEAPLRMREQLDAQLDAATWLADMLRLHEDIEEAGGPDLPQVHPVREAERPRPGLKGVTDQPLSQEQGPLKPEPRPAQEAPAEPAQAPVLPGSSSRVLPPETTEWVPETSLDLHRLRALPMVTAALEAVGLDRDKYGFLLRYGTYAPAGRTSQILVNGLGLADFSRRLSTWFKGIGTSTFPIQVLDEGSGELTVYLLDHTPGKT